MIEPADERLCLLSRSFLSGNDGLQVFLPRMVFVPGERDCERPRPDLPTENNLTLRAPPFGGQFIGSQERSSRDGFFVITGVRPTHDMDRHLDYVRCSTSISRGVEVTVDNIVDETISEAI
jgi:hypothetical protein